MRRKPMQNAGGRSSSHNGGASGGHRRPHSGHSSNNGGGNFNRPRKNYPQLREKYLNQAREMLSQGDRVMAEYYFQHADHCYRMMIEDGSFRQPRPMVAGEENSNEMSVNNGEGNQNGEAALLASAEDSMPENTSALPAFLTMGGGAPAAPAQNWEERDAG
jgi:hypothetical protein